MQIPLELEHLIKEATPNFKENLISTPNRLEVLQARKALEVEHYLRACGLRLGLNECSPPQNARV
jgi:hypothetical protein